MTSLWAVAEFCSALALQIRAGRLATGERALAEAQFDRWLSQRPDPAAPESEDFVASRLMLQHLGPPLQTPDALHLAVCQRLGTDLASFDQGMKKAAAELAIVLIDI